MKFFQELKSFEGEGKQEYRNESHGETVGFSYYKKGRSILNKTDTDEERKTIPYIDDSGKLINVKIGTSYRTLTE